MAPALPAQNPSEMVGWERKNGKMGVGDERAEQKAEEGAMEVESTASVGAGAVGAATAAEGDVAPAVVLDEEAKEEMLKKLHGLLLETAVSEGKLVCGNCGFEYPIKDGVGNFLLPAHLV